MQIFRSLPVKKDLIAKMHVLCSTGENPDEQKSQWEDPAIFSQSSLLISSPKKRIKYNIQQENTEQKNQEQDEEKDERSNKYKEGKKHKKGK